MGNANGTASKVVRVFEPADVPPEVIERLIALMGSEKLLLLANLLDDVIQDTRWGAVEIPINEGRIGHLKSTKSHE